MDEEELTEAWKTVLLLDKTSATKSYEYFKSVIEIYHRRAVIKDMRCTCDKCLGIEKEVD